MNKVVICGVDTSTLPKLTNAQTQALLVKVKAGDQSARDEFIVANMRLILSVIKRFWAKKTNLDDVFQAGCIGLIKAIDNFDLKFQVQFSTYAVPMIIGEIKRFLRDGNSLRVPRSIRDTAYLALKTRGELEKEHMDGSLENVARAMQVAVSEVAFALDAISDTVSLFDPVFNSEDDTLMLMDQLGDQKNTDERWTEKVAIDCAMNTLEDREKKIIYLRYYEGKTQTEISEEIGISQAQVSRLEKSALSQIKNGIRV